MSSAADRFNAQRAARARTLAAACTADFLINLRPLSDNRRVKLAGIATAADIATHGIGAAARAPEIRPCPTCGRRTRKPSGHRPDCTFAKATTSGHRLTPDAR